MFDGSQILVHQVEAENLIYLKRVWSSFTS
jgi:hypothetical protein